MSGPTMKFIADGKEMSHVLCINDLIPNPIEAANISAWVQQATMVPEVIGGIYYKDCNGQTHTVEIRDAGLYTLLFTLQGMSLKVPVHIVYDNSELPVRYFARALGTTVWAVKLMQFFGLVKRNLTYKDFFEHLYVKPGPTVYDKVRKSPEQLRDPMGWEGEGR